MRYNLKKRVEKKKVLMIIAMAVFIVALVIISFNYFLKISQAKEITGNAITGNAVKQDGTRDIGQECDRYNDCKPCLKCWFGVRPEGAPPVSIALGKPGFSTTITPPLDYTRGFCYLKFNGENCVQGGKQGLCSVKSTADYKCVTSCGSDTECPAPLSGSFCTLGKHRETGTPVNAVADRTYSYYCEPTTKTCCSKLISNKPTQICDIGVKCKTQMSQINPECISVVPQNPVNKYRVTNQPKSWCDGKYEPVNMFTYPR